MLTKLPQKNAKIMLSFFSKNQNQAERYSSIYYPSLPDWDDPKKDTQGPAAGTTKMDVYESLMHLC